MRENSAALTINPITINPLFVFLSLMSLPDPSTNFLFLSPLTDNLYILVLVHHLEQAALNSLTPNSCSPLLFSSNL